MYRVVTTTVSSDVEADQLALGAVETRLAACAQRRAIHSTYRWLDTVEQTDEVAVDFKTSAASVDALVDFIRRRHSYECPEIIVTPIEGGHPPYLAWIDEMTRTPDPAAPGNANG